MKLRTLSAASASVAAMSVGVVGIAGSAGAATPAQNHPKAAAMVAKIEAVANAGQLPANYSCTKASTQLAHISTTQSKLSTRLATAQANQAAATAAGQTTKANAIAARITKAEQFSTALGTVSSLISAQCPA